MDQLLDDMRQQRVAKIRSGRAADELLIEAIFGDMLFGRLPREDDSEALSNGTSLVAVSPLTLSKAV